MAGETDTQRGREALRKLDVLVGKWNTTWEVAGEADEPAIFVYGTDSYEWLAGKHFLLHDTYARMEGFDYNVLEIIGGYDADTQTYAIDSYDSQGNKSSLQAQVDDAGKWTFVGELQRSTLEVSADGTALTATWERSDDGSTWRHWMVLHMTRIR